MKYSAKTLQWKGKVNIYLSIKNQVPYSKPTVPGTLILITLLRISEGESTRKIQNTICWCHIYILGSGKTTKLVQCRRSLSCNSCLLKSVYWGQSLKMRGCY